MENRGGGVHICTQEKSIITLAGGGGRGENKSKKDDARGTKHFLFNGVHQ